MAFIEAGRFYPGLILFFSCWNHSIKQIIYTPLFTLNREKLIKRAAFTSALGELQGNEKFAVQKVDTKKVDKCKVCNSENSENLFFCKYCGHRFSENRLQNLK